MPNRVVPMSRLEEELPVGAAIARWRRDGALKQLVQEDARFLVLDEGARRIVHAAEPAAALRAGIARPDGTILTALRLPDQIRRSGLLHGRPRLVRLRLDPRGVASSVVVLAALADLAEGCRVILLNPVGALPNLRAVEPQPLAAQSERDAISVSARPVEPIRQSPVSAEAVPEAEIPSRFVWRSDADGVLIDLSRTHPDLAEALRGRSWAMLAGDGVIDGPGLIEALAARSTFRALSLTVLGRSFEHRLEISGAPAGRPQAAFSGFSGFAISGERIPRVFEEGPPAIDTRGEIGPTEIQQEEAEEGLSINEHAAFREVARILGVRFAADLPEHEPEPLPAEVAPTGSVMAFPTPPGRLMEAEQRARSAMTELLESLPLGVLVYRGEEILFASQAFLTLTGYADLAALREWGLSRLFRGLAPAERKSKEHVPFADAAGGTQLLHIDHAALLWDGMPAEICLARSPASEQGDASIAVPGDSRARALKVLDTLEEGVVTLDSEGRVVGLNQSAAELVHVHPREVVGGRFAELFSPDSRPTLEAAVDGLQHSGASALHDVTARAGAAPLRLRIARLLGEEVPGYCASLRVIGEAAAVPGQTTDTADTRAASEAEAVWQANALARVDREIRPSLEAILSLTEMMLSDRFDRADHTRLDAYLSDVHLAGSRIAGLLDDLRDLADIQAGRSKLVLTDFALNDLVSSCIAERQTKAARNRIVLRTSLAPGLPPLRADERSIRQAILTVLGKAIDVTEAGGQVIVSTTVAEHGDIALRVRDTGAGMTEEALRLALEPFRSDQKRPADGEEKGFGFTLTKALVESNRGRFRISSRRGEGTLVEMMFSTS